MVFLISTIVHLSDLSYKKIHAIKCKYILIQAVSVLLYQLMLALFVTHNCIHKLSTLHNIDEFSNTSCLEVHYNCFISFA